jgi:Tol biopolymer transport system component
MSRLDITALGVILFSIIALATVAWIGNPTELQAELLQEAGTGPLGPITLEFSLPVNAAALEGRLSLEPQGIATIEAISPRLVSLTPGRIINPKEVTTLRLSPGSIGSNGESLESEQSWKVNLRPPQVAFLGAKPNPQEVYSVALDGSAPVQLTQTGGLVYDFEVSPNGEQIVYSLRNDEGGIDLWLMGRNGQNAHRLLNCGGSRCSTPAYSHDGKRLAYTREAAPIPPDIPRGAPRIWVLDLINNQSAPVYADPQVIGYGPSWSPTGNMLASWDGVNGGIHVTDLQTGEDTLLPTESGEVGGWSPDGTQMLFTRYEQVDQGYHTFIFRADFNSGEEGVFLPGGETDSAYGPPTWSPDGAQVAFSMRTNADNPARSIWVVRPDYLGGPTIGGEADITYAFYNVCAWGSNRTPILPFIDLIRGKFRF